MRFSAMQRLPFAILAVAVLSVLTAKPAHADEWSKTYNLTGKAALRIETSDANIKVTTWDQNTIAAKVITERYKIGEGGIRVEEHQSGGGSPLTIHTGDGLIHLRKGWCLTFVL